MLTINTPGSHKGQSPNDAGNHAYINSHLFQYTSVPLQDNEVAGVNKRNKGFQNTIRWMDVELYSGLSCLHVQTS